jgi:hypothetical protein
MGWISLTQIFNIFQGLEFSVERLMVNFGRTENELDLMTV